jgi:hypothetical protein
MEEKKMKRQKGLVKSQIASPEIILSLETIRKIQAESHERLRRIVEKHGGTLLDESHPEHQRMLRATGGPGAIEVIVRRK